MIFYTNRFIPKRFAAYTIGPVILIRPEDKDDGPLLVHEQTHVKQFKRTLGLNGVLGLFESYRRKYEVEAYKAQIAAGADLDRCAELLATNYNLDLTQDQARKLLT